MNHIIYRKYHDNKWYRQEFKRQCSHLLWIGLYECQGVIGHEGDHWAYAEDGSYLHSSPDGSETSTPPDHVTWISPKDKVNEHHRMFYTFEEVTDSTIIAQLEKGETPEEEAALDRPCTPQEIEALKKEGRM